jgi:rSAM/selenodomain-associated transferase 1
MDQILYIAAKAPRPCYAKTRLGQAFGHMHAINLYRAFLHDLAARFAQAPFPVGWYVTPPDAWTDLAPLVGASERVVAQGDGDWSARQRALFAGAARRGEQRVVLIASDSPQITVATVADAFALLAHHEVVLGPVHDGGYYLVGMRGWHDIFSGVLMSTATVLADLIAQAQQQGLRVAYVEPMFDIDTADDLHHLAPLAYTRSDLPVLLHLRGHPSARPPHLGYRHMQRGGAS